MMTLDEEIERWVEHGFSREEAQQHILRNRAHTAMMDELPSMVRELVKSGFDRVALAKTLVIVDEYLIPGQPMSEQVLDAMLERLFWYWVEVEDLTDRRDELKALRAMTPAELKALQWYDQCHDCGDRAWAQLRENYMVHREVWHQACIAEPVMKDDCGKLCIRCIERRLGRRLNYTDFGLDAPSNTEVDPRTSGRLLERLQS
jgi:hypothetical protein